MKYYHNLILPRNVRVMIGVGGGQPRDDDPRSHAILTTRPPTAPPSCASNTMLTPHKNAF